MSNSVLKELKKVVPQENILTEIEERYVYAHDASNDPYIKTEIPEAVVFAETIEQVQHIVKIANKTGTPIICRGAGTNTVGACAPVTGGIILNFSKMNKILDINPVNMTARVQPGVVVADLQKKAESFGLFYPPDPSNLQVSTIGGSIAQNSAGARCFKYGATKDYILDMLVVTADGNLLRTGSTTVKNAVGYNLGSLFVGSEGTLGIVVEAVVKLIPKPQSSQVIMAYFDDIDNAVFCVNKIIEARVYPSTLDFMDNNVLKTIEQFCPTGLLTDKEAALIIEVDGLSESISSQRESVCRILRENNAVQIQYSRSEADSENIWKARRSSMAACSRLKPNVTTDDLIVPRQNLSKLVRGVKSICERYDLIVCMVGHVGDGSIHPQIPIDYSDQEEYRRYKLAKSEIYQLAINLGGTISGEHGIGIEKKPYISRVVSSESLDYMRQIKKIFDPKNILNPYKIF